MDASSGQDACAEIRISCVQPTVGENVAPIHRAYAHPRLELPPPILGPGVKGCAKARQGSHPELRSVVTGAVHPGAPLGFPCAPGLPMQRARKAGGDEVIVHGIIDRSINKSCAGRPANLPSRAGIDRTRILMNRFLERSLRRGVTAPAVGTALHVELLSEAPSERVKALLSIPGALRVSSRHEYKTPALFVAIPSVVTADCFFDCPKGSFSGSGIEASALERVSATSKSASGC